jgi:hypothetical protein
LKKLCIAICTIGLLGFVRPETVLAAIEGPVTLARVGEESVVIWDCTQRLGELRDAKATNDDVMRDLESNAALVLGQEAQAVEKDTRHVTVRVLYRKLGSFDPTYRAVTFAGIERLLNLTVATPFSMPQVVNWSMQLKAGKAPPDVTITISGSLPAQ